MRSYRDEGEHYSGQLGSEETPQAFLEALWAVTAECWRVLKPTGSCWINLGDKYAGSSGQNNNGSQGSTLTGGRSKIGPVVLGGVPGRYMQNSGDIRPKSLMGLPWRYALGCIDGQAAPNGQRWILRAEVIWSKPNGLPESVTDRVRRSHEQWFMFTKQGRYFAAVDEVREAHDDKAGPASRFGNITVSGSSRTDGVSREQTFSPPERVYNPLGKLPGSVWNIPSEPLIIPPAVAQRYDLPDHFAAFPQEWPRRIILGWSPSGICTACGEGRRPVVAKELGDLTWQGSAQRHGRKTQERLADPTHNKGSHATRLGELASWYGGITGYHCACAGGNPCVYPAPTRPAVILDPFGGTGTTAMVARALGRFGISLDLSADYCRLAQWRIFSSRHGAKAMQRTHKANQGDLFGMGSDADIPTRPIEDVAGL